MHLPSYINVRFSNFFLIFIQYSVSFVLIPQYNFIILSLKFASSNLQSKPKHTYDVNSGFFFHLIYLLTVDFKILNIYVKMEIIKFSKDYVFVRQKLVLRKKKGRKCSLTEVNLYRCKIKTTFSIYILKIKFMIYMMNMKAYSLKVNMIQENKKIMRLILD